jgi:hypothetical protein
MIARPERRGSAQSSAAIASARRNRYIRSINGIARQGRAMRAEVQHIVDEIKQSVGLLRRHL